MLVQAHRGVSTEYPENTMPAFEAAHAQGYPIIEFDPRITADGECVVFHDTTVNRTCRNADGTPITQELIAGYLTLKQLQSFDAGLYMGEQFRGTKVPLMSQVLAYARDHGMMVKIDNRFAVWPEEQLNKLFQVVEESGIPDPGFTCLNLDILDKVLARFPNAVIHYDGPVDEQTLRKIRARLHGNRLIIWLPLPTKLTAWVKVPLATPELCRLVKNYGELGIWILHTQEEAARAQALGADIIETTGAIKPWQCV